MSGTRMRPGTPTGACVRAAPQKSSGAGRGGEGWGRHPPSLVSKLAVAAERSHGVGSEPRRGLRKGR